MKPPSTAEADFKLWGVVTATVRPLSGRKRPRPCATAATGAAGGATGSSAAPIHGAPPPRMESSGAAGRTPSTPAAAPPVKKIKPARVDTPPAPEALEPGRRRRVERGRDAPAGVIDLHGLTQDQARDALTRFVLHGFAERRRTLLVITGKGALGDGVLRRRVPEWLGQAPLRPMIAGLSEAHRRHGGEGALYVALRRA
jgi:DNA-nicking Smr family endonuclease